MTMRYPAVVPKEGKNLLADFPTCPGCHTFAPQGRDIEHEAKEALELWLESHRKERILPPRPPRTLKARKGTMLWVPVEPKLAVARTALDARGSRPDPGRAREARRRQPARDRPAREPGLQPDDRHAQPRCPGHGSRDRFPLVRGRVRKVVRQAAPSPRAWSGARTRDRRNARPPSWQTFASVAYAVEPPKTVSDVLTAPCSRGGGSSPRRTDTPSHARARSRSWTRRRRCLALPFAVRGGRCRASWSMRWAPFRNKRTLARASSRLSGRQVRSILDCRLTSIPECRPPPEGQHFGQIHGEIMRTSIPARMTASLVLMGGLGWKDTFAKQSVGAPPEESAERRKALLADSYGRLPLT